MLEMVGKSYRGLSTSGGVKLMLTEDGILMREMDAAHAVILQLLLKRASFEELGQPVGGENTTDEAVLDCTNFAKDVAIMQAMGGETITLETGDGRYALSAGRTRRRGSLYARSVHKSPSKLPDIQPHLKLVVFVDSVELDRVRRALEKASSGSRSEWLEVVATNRDGQCELLFNLMEGDSGVSDLSLSIFAKSHRPAQAPSAGSPAGESPARCRSAFSVDTTLRLLAANPTGDVEIAIGDDAPMSFAYETANDFGRCIAIVAPRIG